MNKEALKKAANFCAYQERTHREVKERLDEWGIWGDEADEIVVWLIENNYLNEERFAKVFAGSKFRVKQWGRLKIRQELKMRGVSDYCLQMGMNEIDDDDYINTLQQLITKKQAEIKDTNPLVVKQKLLRYTLSKGYEQDLVWEVLNKWPKE
ncbi:regulatory protein RecX [Flectobacillus major]|jgi:regulatory protein|uniref:regulatory protein RecX n=1 Tax=Flectobacillus major TaxID=103 RepID=UPI000414004A|nr:regulatory protein RecX [Flectobacillus major]